MDAEIVDNVRFYSRPVLDHAATKEAGRAIHTDAVYVEISNPGDRHNVVDRPLRATDKEKYPRHWAAFQNSNSQEAIVGTRLSAWGQMSAAKVEDFKYLKILTVEQLASVPDSALHHLGLGGRADRQAAKDFLEAAKSTAPITRLQAELDQERAQRKALEAALKAQGDRLEAVAAGRDVEVAREIGVPPSITTDNTDQPMTPKKRGRPAKAQAEG